jgi:7-carboxy-7-deazaguanine synthase
MSLLINEIFYSLQGESTEAGRPSVFVRVTGCNLRCTYCDTTYAYEAGRKMPLEAIVDQVSAFKCSLVTVTGGEPLLQEQTPQLVETLLDRGCEVLLETNGSRNIDRIDRRCSRIVDMKCPSSGQSDRNDLRNLTRLSDRDQLKFVIGNRADYDFAKRLIARLPGGFAGRRILLSPVAGVLTPATAAEWILADRLQVRLHLQWHKVIWPGVPRGV